MKDLTERVLNFLRDNLKKVTYVLSYQTGIGWEYLPEDKYHDKLSRDLQRNNCSPNNILVRSCAGDYFDFDA